MMLGITRQALNKRLKKAGRPRVTRRAATASRHPDALASPNTRPRPASFGRGLSCWKGGAGAAGLQVTCSSAKKLDSTTCQKYKQLTRYGPTASQRILEKSGRHDPGRGHDRGPRRDHCPSTAPSRRSRDIRRRRWWGILLLNCSSCQIAARAKALPLVRHVRQGQPEPAAVQPDAQGRPSRSTSSRMPRSSRTGSATSPARSRP